MQFVRCRPVNVEASLPAASAADELIDSLGVCADWYKQVAADL